jgi:hypothetical protein
VLRHSKHLSTDILAISRSHIESSTFFIVAILCRNVLLEWMQNIGCCGHVCLTIAQHWANKQAPTIRFKVACTALAARQGAEYQARRRKKFLLLLALMKLEEDSAKKKETYKQLLNEEGRLCRDQRIPRCALVNPADTPLEKVYKSGRDSAMITVAGFDGKAFQHLLQLFEPFLMSSHLGLGATKEQLTRK